jgi:3-hydroxy-9,10-secoandrosta-1,3,5(10)-triene-9,17-dione monooxygenase reductase component
MASPDPAPFPEISSAEYRHVLGHFVTGVTIITGTDPDSGEPVGLAASSFTSVSLDPPLVLFCAGKTSASWARIQASRAFCVNVLGEDNETISRTFATRGADKFSGLAWTKGPSGSPVLGDALASMDCVVHEEHDAGDHVIVVGRVLALTAADRGAPLAYFRGGYGRFTS